MTLRLLPIFLTAVTIGGCATATVRQPVTTPFAGTWYQMPKEIIDEPSGFLAIGQDHLLFNLNGLPRGSISIANNDTDVGLQSGRLIGTDGRVLYVAVAETISEQPTGNQRVFAPTTHLDVHWFSVGAGPSDQPMAVLRLWPASALAALSAHSATSLSSSLSSTFFASPSATATTAIGVDSAEHHFVEVAKYLLNGYLANIATQLISARHAGKNNSALDLAYHRQTNAVRSDIVTELEAAYRGDSQALIRADHQLADLATVDNAFHQWRNQP